MEINRALVPPCGLYCGVCGILVAHKSGNQKFKERLAPVYGIKPEDVACEGCLSDVVFKYCQVCPIKSCAQERGYEGCHLCDEFPCKHVEIFPMKAGKKAILRAIPQWKTMTTEEWVAAEEERYHCPKCGNKIFRGAKSCNKCKEPVDLD